LHRVCLRLSAVFLLVEYLVRSGAVPCGTGFRITPLESFNNVVVPDKP